MTLRVVSGHSAILNFYHDTQLFYPFIPSSLQAMLNRNGGLIACLSAYARLSNAFQLPELSPRQKYIAHISEAKCLGQTHREVKYTFCHLI